LSTRCTSLPACLSTTTKVVCTKTLKNGLKSVRLTRPRVTHNKTGEDDSDAHLKRQLMGREVVVAITNGQFDFGPWEQIFYGEFDGRRQKRVLVKVIGE
jgi:secondary thiamine-phosphate synthase enzyme